MERRRRVGDARAGAGACVIYRKPPRPGRKGGRPRTGGGAPRRSAFRRRRTVPHDRQVQGSAPSVRTLVRGRTPLFAPAADSCRNGLAHALASRAGDEHGAFDHRRLRRRGGWRRFDYGALAVFGWRRIQRPHGAEHPNDSPRGILARPRRRSRRRLRRDRGADQRAGRGGVASVYAHRGGRRAAGGAGGRIDPARRRRDARRPARAGGTTENRHRRCQREHRPLFADPAATARRGGRIT